MVTNPDVLGYDRSKKTEIQSPVVYGADEGNKGGLSIIKKQIDTRKGLKFIWNPEKTVSRENINKLTDELMLDLPPLARSEPSSLLELKNERFNTFLQKFFAFCDLDIQGVLECFVSEETKTFLSKKYQDAKNTKYLEDQMLDAEKYKLATSKYKDTYSVLEKMQKVILDIQIQFLEEVRKSGEKSISDSKALSILIAYSCKIDKILALFDTAVRYNMLSEFMD